ncbi:DUF397 domain-containing protein [Spirillospora sp. CA-255316]
MSTQAGLAPQWRKSSYSGGEGGQCIELASLEASSVAIRDSKAPSAGHLSVAKRDLMPLVARIKAGLLDI